MAGIRLMAIWLLAYHLYHYAQREINIAKENARLAIIAKDAQLSSLSAQLNPHFLFNSLNNIKALVIENPKSARRAIDLLSDLLRTALYSDDVLLTTVKDELALVKDYFELEKLRFEERLQFCIEADDRLNNALILRFSIQTLAENAIKHGIARQKSGGLVSVKVVVVDNYINISVQNPGEFNMDEQNEGLGIKNLTERLQLQYKGLAKFGIINEAGGNVLSTILIPRS
ncbi:sensor histidine kinase [Mucilaginibacter mallensis]|nr:histidine kinase [Mucilaginibacter mallensis]